MSGRFALTSPPPAVRGHFGYPEEPAFPPRYNIAPTQPIAVVTARAFTQGRERRFQLMRWGFLPGFVRDVRTFPLLIQARAESLPDKPSFRAAFKRRRGLVPADGFYAWRDGGRGQPKQPFYVRAVGGGLLAFAALYETYLDASGGEIDTACLVTTPANALLSPIGERMPAILPREAFPLWLDGETTACDAALDLLRPAPEALLEAIPVGPAVGASGSEGPGLQTPAGAPLRSPC